MTLYEIDSRIADILDNLDDEYALQDTVADELEVLAMSRQEKLENCAKAYIQAKADAEQVEQEINRLADKKRSFKAKAKRILDYLAYCCHGEKTDCGVATLSYPKPLPSLTVVDAAKCASWLEDNGHGDLVTYDSPKISAREVKQIMLSGVDVPGAKIEYKERVQLK